MGLDYGRKEIVGTQHQETYNGYALTVFTAPQSCGGWCAKAELDLGRTGHLVFEDAAARYESEEEAKKAVLELAARGLACSRIGKSNT